MCPQRVEGELPLPPAPLLGFGLGLRTPHFEDLLNTSPDIDFLEILSENFMVAGGKPMYYLSAMRERYPLVMHGVSLSIGSVEPLNRDYLQQLKKLADTVEPRWISDHLCFTSGGGINSHDLLPLPYTEEALSHVAGRVRQVQDFLGRPLVLENVSTYLQYRDSSMREWEFLRALCRECGCELLLDVNNVYVSSRNHGFDPYEFIDGIEPGDVRQIHMAGHTDNGDHCIDTHDQAVVPAVSALYQAALQHCGPVSTLLERDDNIPPLKDLLRELNEIRSVARAALVPRWQDAVTG